MVASEHPEVMERGRRLIDTDFLDPEEAAEGGSIDNCGVALDEERENILEEADVRTCVTQSGTEKVEEVQQVVKYSSLSSYLLKPHSLLT